MTFSHVLFFHALQLCIFCIHLPRPFDPVEQERSNKILSDVIGMRGVPKNGSKYVSLNIYVTMSYDESSTAIA